MISEAAAYHALNCIHRAQYEVLKKLYEQYGSWNTALKKSQPDNMESATLSPEISLLLADAPSFPPLLKEIPWPVFGLYIRGTLPAGRTVSIVGTRKATPQGLQIAERLASDFARQHITVISGLALGVDAAAHKGALSAGGKTAAVLATGLDTIYPASNSGIADQIIKTGGALLSEYPPGHPSYPANFIHRNRIVSGLSSAVIVVEAPEKSGTLATTRFALEQNREVFVVPGPAHHPNYYGSHELIRAGARLVRNAHDILDDLNWLPDAAESASQLNIGAEERAVLEAIKKLGWPASIDKIALISTIDVRKVNEIVSLLTIKGLIS